jgi:single stranded DNA-binding protein
MTRGPLHEHRHRRGQPACRGAQRIQQDGQWRDGETSFFKVNVWRGAEHLADSLSKGDRVMVTGGLRQRSWETPEGDKRSVTELEADEVGASLKWATAKVERTSQRGNGQRDQGRERQAERGGDFNDGWGTSSSPGIAEAISASVAPHRRCRRRYNGAVTKRGQAISTSAALLATSRARMTCSSIRLPGW